jgi:high affinity Mn2+ porin
VAERDHQSGCAAGGLGILIGDGRLSYQPEKIFEAYYAYSLNRWAALTLDYQFVADPAYNRTAVRCRSSLHAFTRNSDGQSPDEPMVPS